MHSPTSTRSWPTTTSASFRSSPRPRPPPDLPGPRRRTPNAAEVLKGATPQAQLLGIFQLSVLHNLVHLAIGGAGVVLSRSAARAMTYLSAGGVIYVVLWLYGVFIGRDSGANFVPVNSAGNWLHLILGLGMIAARALLTRNRHTEHPVRHDARRA
ncbi:DUF4383 domain-containing protein [Streptomyces sp. NPDC058122]|uniref:DUF4383 domain-containing protein n=1 Tax=Streptomyces sp. NPDC058122 TaxID=3346349 RepID=UPI0036E2DA99